MFIRIRLLKNWTNDGTEFASGKILDIDNEAVVKDLVEKGIAERVEAEPVKVQVKAAAEPAPKNPEPTIDAESLRTVLAEEIAKFAGGTKRPGITVGKDRREDDPNKGYKTHKHFLLEVMDVCRGTPMTDGLKLLARIQGKAVGGDEQSVFADPYGGFLLPEAFTPELLRIEPEADPMAGKTRMVPMQAAHVSFPARVDKDHSTSVSGGLTVSRREEAGTFAASRMKLEKVKLEAHMLAGLDYCTEEVLSDSPISFVALLASGFSDQFTSHMIDERLNGSGVGRYMGIMKSPCLLTITAEEGQRAATVVYENLVEMMARCWQYGQAMWMANHTVLPQLMKLNQTAGIAGNPTAWQPSAREGTPGVIFGQPLILTEYCAAVGTTGDIVLGNWREYLEGIFQPLQSAESVHVRFLQHERTFKFWLRNAGAPWWRSVLTPKNGATLSPFVVLATRS